MPLWWRSTIQMIAVGLFLFGIWDENLGDRDGVFWVLCGVFLLMYLLVEGFRINGVVRKRRGHEPNEGRRGRERPAAHPVEPTDSIAGGFDSIRHHLFDATRASDR